MKCMPVIFAFGCAWILIICTGCTQQAVYQHDTARSRNTNKNHYQVTYERFTLWLDCEKHGAIKFQYYLTQDTGHLPRAQSFYLDDKVPADCQQKSAKPYGHHYDRGHLVPANHLDDSSTALLQSNAMTNILPQTATMNRGAWLATEEIIECYRDLGDLLIIGGVIWGDNENDDYFVDSHGIRTPDAFWKVIMMAHTPIQEAISWIVPNSFAAQRSQLDHYLVSIAEIEKLTGESIPVDESLKNTLPKTSWAIPENCNKS